MQGGNPFDRQGFGQPGFGGMPFDENDSFIAGGGVQKRRRQDPNSNEIQREHGVFHEKLGSILGPAYVGAFGLGAIYGLTKTPPMRARRTYRLYINNYLNEIGKTSSRWANQTAAAVFLYLLVGKCINFVFYEELEHLPDSAKASTYGLFTGLLYKSTRGFRPALFGSVLGASFGYAFASFWERSSDGKKFGL
ncbi:unnamed protein product [Moneuplotes crassus]|uniref:Uncharacterized protein n=1 Tax=Euplotes crassus TaxID=5936 RepID=A0AAD1XVU8_EUPCR|nr:unnamed protein product [Moneuplotes crassus]